MELQLLLTQKCNLNCKYCYINQNSNDLDKKTLDKSYDFFMSHMYDSEWGNITMSFFGGEPLINYRLISEIATDNKYMSYFKVLPTNGYLLNEENYDELTNKFKVSVGISYDGISNYLRSPDSLPEFAMNLIRQNRGCKVMINSDSINEIHKNFLYFIEQGINFPDFTLVRDNIWSLEDISKFKNELDKINETILSEIKKNNLVLPGFYTLYLLDTLFAIRFGKRPFSCFAGTGKQGICISTNGDFYPCARFASNDKMKLIDMKTKTINWENYNFLREISGTHKFDECQNCIIRQYCNTQCNYSMLLNGKDQRMKPISNLCEIMKLCYQYSFQIWDELKDNTFFIDYMNNRIKNAG